MHSATLTFSLGVITGALALAVGFVLGGAHQNEPPTLNQASANQAQSPSAQVIQATQLQIVDELGTVVMVIGSNKDGGTISLRDRLGKTAMLLGAAEHGGAMIIRSSATSQPAFIAQADAQGGLTKIFDQQGTLAAETAVKANGTQLHLNDANGRHAISLSANAEEGGAISAHATTGEIATRLFSNIEGEGVIETYRPDGAALVSLSSTEGGHGRVTTFAGLNKPLVTLTATANHEGQMYLSEASGRTLIALASSPAGPTLRLFNRFGEPAITLDSTEEGKGAVGVWNRDGTGRTVSP
jgi:hypothetical protein